MDFATSRINIFKVIALNIYKILKILSSKVCHPMVYNGSQITPDIENLRRKTLQETYNTPGNALKSII